LLTLLAVEEVEVIVELKVWVGHNGQQTLLAVVLDSADLPVAAASTTSRGRQQRALSEACENASNEQQHLQQQCRLRRLKVGRGTVGRAEHT